MGPEIFDEQIGNRLNGFFLPSEIDCLKKFKSETEKLLLNYFREQHFPTNPNNIYGVIYILAYLKSQRALPLLRQQLLADRYFYGWEGPDYTREGTYFSDYQYPHHQAYITAIEEITGFPIGEAVHLSLEERKKLEKEAQLTDIQPPNIQLTKNYCAKWLLIKLTSENTKNKNRKITSY